MYVYCMGINFSPESWRSFLNATSLDLMRRFLSVGDMQSVFLVHDRHMVCDVFSLSLYACVFVFCRYYIFLCDVGRGCVCVIGGTLIIY